MSGRAIGAGAQYIQERALFLRAEQSVAFQALLAGAFVYSAVTGASLVLPATGTYCIQYTGRGNVDLTPKFVLYRLFDVTAAAALPTTEGLSGFIALTVGAFNSRQGTAQMTTFLTITTAPVTVRLEAAASAALGCSTLSSVLGRTVITAFRLAGS